LTSLVEAEFLHNEVPGIEVPEEVLGRMEAADTHGPDAARAEGVQVAIEMLEHVRDLVAGVHIGVPAEHLDAALAVLAGLEATG
jgi:homocysteine S-methyltransferase